MRLLAIPTALVLAATAAQALPVTYNLEFTIDVTDVDTADFLGTTFSGTVTIDDGLLDAFGDGVAIGSEAEISIDFDGVTYTEVQDIGYPGYPEVEFFDFDPVFIDFIIEDGINGVAFNDPDVFALSMFTDLTNVGGTFEGFAELNYGFAPVPVPAGAPLALGALAAFGWVRRRQVAQRG